MCINEAKDTVETSGGWRHQEHVLKKAVSYEWGQPKSKAMGVATSEGTEVGILKLFGARHISMNC